MNLSDEERRRRADRMREVAAKGRAAKAQAAAQAAKAEFEAIETGYIPSASVEITPQFPWDDKVPFDVARYYRLKAFYAKRKAAGQ